jgi:surface protein
MASMFGGYWGCSNLVNLDLSNFNTANVTDMYEMFRNCSSLVSLDLSSFNTANVNNMHQMFLSCSSLTTIYVGEGWTTENVTTSEMFKHCPDLVGGRGTTYDANHIGIEYAHIDGGTSNPGYLTDINGPLPYAVLSENNTILMFYYDDQKAARNGMSVGPFTSTDSREWKDDVTTITYVEFDSSFADCTSITSTARWFDGCSNLTEISGISYLHTENVTSMRRMFKDCSSLTGIDLSHFNTENVTKMDYMFDGCSGLNKLDVSGFNTGNVTEMGSMFANCSSLKSLDVTGFNTESVTDISRMFYSCSGLTTLDLSNFNTANAKEDLSNLFRNCSSLMTIYVGSGWTTDNMTNGENMFLNCTNLEGGAGTKYDTNHTDHAYAHIDGGTSNPGYLTGPSQPRPYAVLSGNNTVLTFYYDDQKVARNGMSVGPFEQWGGQGTKSGWSDVNEQITTVVFNNSFANFTKLTSTAYWFYGCENLTTITGMSNLKTDNVTDINSMFGDCHSLKSIDFSSLNLSNVTNMHQVFEDCRALESIDFSGVNTENVTNMGDLFLNCKSLKTIDISSFNTKNVTKMTSMFYKCDVLTTIYVGEGWTTENVTESGEMFEKSPNLVGGRGTTYDENHIGIEYAHIDGGTSNPGYLTDINGASEETWAKLQSRIEYGTDVLAKAKEISSVDQALIEKLDEALQNANQMYKIHEASEDEVLHMIEVLNERINDVEEAMNQPASEETWEELKATIEYGTDVLAKAKEISTIDQWLIEELEMMLESGNQMYKIHEASEEDVRNMIDELNWRIKEVEEAMNQPASDEAWAELNKAVETGEKLQTEAKGVSTVEPWALEELENMTAKGSEMYKVHTAGEEEVRHMTEELNQIINEVEEMMRKQPQGEASFDGLTAYVSGNATLDDAFKSVGGRSEAAKTIAAIVWNADNALTADMLSGIDNPNLLVYVTEASKAPSGVQNVIIDGVASEIVLTDATGNNNFYCPQSFTAKSISYSRDFSQTTEIDVCRGWETIALPFDVQSITHESHGTLVPFGGSDNGYPFWLRQLSTNGLARATKIEANRPYLICMPNNIIYPPEYNQNGTVTFSSSNVTVPVTSARSSTSAGVTLHATFQQVTKSSSVYALNVGETRGEYPEGSVFEQNYRDIRPFQAYTTHRASTRSFITLESLGGNDDATGIEELRIKNSEFGDAEGVWYSLDGRRLDAKPTKKGVYVKDGRKIVIK